MLNVQFFLINERFVWFVNELKINQGFFSFVNEKFR